MNEDKIVAAFARKLKLLRLSHGWTLEDLAKASGVSISTISKIENRQQSPSFETVLRMARALRLNFVQMLDDAEAPATAMARRVITRDHEAQVYDGHYYVYATHAAEMTRRRMIPLLMRIKTRTVPPPADWSIHDGEEFIYVMDGALEFHTEQYQPALLTKGDSCYIDSTMRHAFVSKGKEDAMVLSVNLSIKPFAAA